MLSLVKTKLPNECRACFLLYCWLRPAAFSSWPLGSSLVTSVVVVVVNESLDSKEQVRALFLQHNVNVLILDRFPKSFYPDVVFCAVAAVHTRHHLRIFSTGVSQFIVKHYPINNRNLIFLWWSPDSWTPLLFPSLIAGYIALNRRDVNQGFLYRGILYHMRRR